MSGMAVNNVYITSLLKLETTCNVLLKKLPLLIRFDNRRSIYRPSPKSYGIKIIIGHSVISFPMMPIFKLKLNIQSRAPGRSGAVVLTTIYANTFWSNYNYEHVLAVVVITQ